MGRRQLRHFRAYIIRGTNPTLFSFTSHCWYIKLLTDPYSKYLVLRWLNGNPPFQTSAREQSTNIASPIKTDDPITHYTGPGVALGTCFGTVFGVAFGNAGTGLGLGLAIGLAVGTDIGTRVKKQQNDTNDEPD